MVPSVPWFLRVSWFLYLYTVPWFQAFHGSYIYLLAVPWFLVYCSKVPWILYTVPTFLLFHGSKRSMVPTVPRVPWVLRFQAFHGSYCSMVPTVPWFQEFGSKRSKVPTGCSTVPTVPISRFLYCSKVPTGCSIVPWFHASVPWFLLFQGCYSQFHGSHKSALYMVPIVLLFHSSQRPSIPYNSKRSVVFILFHSSYILIHVSSVPLFSSFHSFISLFSKNVL